MSHLGGMPRSRIALESLSEDLEEIAEHFGSGSQSTDLVRPIPLTNWHECVTAPYRNALCWLL